MYRLNSRLLYTRTAGMQRPINYRMVQARRSYSSDDGRKGGNGLTWVAILALAAGGYLFFSRKETPPPPLTDPYHRTKENLGQLQEKVVKVGKDVNKEYGDDFNHEVNKLGDHLKSTASIASDAAQTAYKDLKSSTKDEVDAVIDSLKDETTKLSQELKVETDKFRAEHHLKEGDRPAEDIVAHTHNDTIHEASRVSVTGKKIVQDANEAAFNAASKLGTEIKQKAKDASDYLSSETGKSKSYLKNPMVEEKRSADRTKTLDELRLENKAKNVVHDTSILVENDTNKVKDLWNAKDEHNKHTYGSTPTTTDHLGKGSSSLSSSWEDLKEDAQDVFRNETLTAKEVWKDGKDKVESETHRLKRQASDSWNDLTDEAKKRADKTQSSWSSLKEDAQDVFRNETLTAKEVWKDDKDKVESETHRLKRQASDSWNDLTDEAKKQADKTQSSWSSLKEDVKDDAENLLHKVEDAASGVTGRYKKEADKVSNEWDKTHRDAQTKAKELKRSASDAVYNTADDISSSVESLKKEGEQTVKGWLNKGDQHANELNNKADENLKWAEKKVDEAKNWAQDSVDGLKGNLKNAQEKVSDTLNDHENEHLIPAEVIVEDAKRHNI